MEPPGEGQRTDDEAIGGDGDGCSVQLDVGRHRREVRRGKRRAAERTGLRSGDGWAVPPATVRHLDLRVLEANSWCGDYHGDSPSDGNRYQGLAMFVLVVGGRRRPRRTPSARADWSLWRALGAEEFALRGLQDALEHFRRTGAALGSVTRRAGYGERGSRHPSRRKRRAGASADCEMKPMPRHSK